MTNLTIFILKRFQGNKQKKHDIEWFTLACGLKIGRQGKEKNIPGQGPWQVFVAWAFRTLGLQTLPSRFFQSLSPQIYTLSEAFVANSLNYVPHDCLRIRWFGIHFASKLSIFCWDYAFNFSTCENWVSNDRHEENSIGNASEISNRMTFEPLFLFYKIEQNNFFAFLARCHAEFFW